MLIAIENPLDSSPMIFPVLECIHILGFAFSVGTIALVDFRMLGWGLRHQSPAEVYSDMAPWTLFGLGMMLFSGPLLFASDPDMYYLNRSFQVKMVLLVLAIIFNYTVHKKTVLSGASSGRAKTMAWISILLWVGVVAGGLYIAFV